MNVTTEIQNDTSIPLSRGGRFATGSQYVTLPSIETVRREFHQSKLAYRQSNDAWFRQFLRGHFQYLIWVYQQQREATR